MLDFLSRDLCLSHSFSQNHHSCYHRGHSRHWDWRRWLHHAATKNTRSRPIQQQHYHACKDWLTRLCRMTARRCWASWHRLRRKYSTLEPSGAKKNLVVLFFPNLRWRIILRQQSVWSATRSSCTADDPLGPPRPCACGGGALHWVPGCNRSQRSRPVPVPYKANCRIPGSLCNLRVLRSVFDAGSL